MLFRQTPTSQPIPHLFLLQTPTTVEPNICYLADRREGVRCRRREEPNLFEGNDCSRIVTHGGGSRIPTWVLGGGGGTFVPTTKNKLW
ncbi:hypothetical protein Hanom_Chr00s000006g01613731 [Helianthus anomalus]